MSFSYIWLESLFRPRLLSSRVICSWELFLSFSRKGDDFHFEDLKFVALESSSTFFCVKPIHIHLLLQNGYSQWKGKDRNLIMNAIIRHLLLFEKARKYLFMSSSLFLPKRELKFYWKVISLRGWLPFYCFFWGLQFRLWFLYLRVCLDNLCINCDFRVTPKILFPPFVFRTRQYIFYLVVNVWIQWHWVPYHKEGLDSKSLEDAPSDRLVMKLLTLPLSWFLNLFCGWDSHDSSVSICVSCITGRRA